MFEGTLMQILAYGLALLGVGVAPPNGLSTGRVLQLRLD